MNPLSRWLGRKDAGADPPAPQTSPDLGNPIVFIISWGRPLYLWNCLDSLFRLTKVPCRFILMDNFSGDPEVTRVIEAFERRHLFHAVHRFETNTRENWLNTWKQYIDSAGPVYFQIESDVEITSIPGDCWLTEMAAVHRANPGAGMLGSLIDPIDFAGIEHLEDEGDATQRFLSKADSPERDIDFETASRLDFLHTEYPFGINNPPGRLLALDAEVMREVGPNPDHQLAELFRERGFRPGIAGRIRHRHLSLLNYFDYPNYSAETRDRYMLEGRPLDSSPIPPKTEKESPSDP